MDEEIKDRLEAVEIRLTKIEVAFKILEIARRKKDYLAKKINDLKSISNESAEYNTLKKELDLVVDEINAKLKDAMQYFF